MQRAVIILGLALLSLVIVVRADEAAPPAHVSVGPGHGVNVPGDGREPCDGFTEIYHNDDGSFENGYAWQYGGVEAPYYGAFAEGFYIPNGNLACVQLRLTTAPGYYADQPLDVYVWGSDGNNPSNVLSMRAGVHLESPPAVWPNVSTHNIECSSVDLPYEVFIGFWGNWPGGRSGWFVAADLDGFGGRPRTNIAPGTGYPTGWNDPSRVWGPTQSLGIGAVMFNDYQGACCYPEGGCQVVTYMHCGGVFLWGQGCLQCDPPATGACCGSDGSCAITTRFDCGSGDWRVGAACEPSPCPASALGACCLEGVCTLAAEGDCPAGAWLGPNTRCQPSPCPEHPAEEASCVAYESYAHWVASTGHSAARVVAVNGCACVGGEGEFRVVDLADPRDPRVLSSLSLTVSGMAASGTLVYAAASAPGPGGALVVIDIADPEVPTLVGSVPLAVDGTNVAVQGEFAYVITDYYQANLVIVDVGEPQNPVIVGSVPVTEASDVAVTGMHAYVAMRDGLAVVDVSDPTTPRIVGTTDLDGDYSGVDVYGAYALVAKLSDGLVFIDVSDPANPAVAGSLPTPGGARRVRVSGTYAYVACHTESDIAMVDVSDPLHPAMIGLVGVTDIESYGIWDLAVAGTVACVTTPLNGLHVIDVANPRTAPVLGSVDTPEHRLAVAGDYAYLAGGWDSLRVVDVRDPNGPRIVGSVGAPGYCSDIDVAGSHAFVAGSYRPPRTGGYLAAIDATDPAHPETADVVDLPDLEYCEYCVAVSGSQAVVAGGYYADFANLRTIDLSDPWDLHIVGEVSLPVGPADVDLSGDYAYVADEDSGVLAVDVSVPSNPRIVGSARIQDFSAKGIDVLGTTACVALDGGVQVIDVSQPQDLQTVGLAYHAWEPHRVSMQGTYAAITDRYAGVLLIDLVNPWSPRIVGGLAGYGLDVAATNGFLFATLGDLGLQVLHAPCAPNPREGENASADDVTAGGAGVRALPNPSLRHATIRLELAAGSHARVTIHDLTGRRIRDLFEGRLPDAARDLVWDGRDDGGRTVAAGVYLARVSSTAGTMTRRLVVLR